jgi:hypothetical protein
VDYLNKPEFGKIPGYITRIKRQVDRENQRIQKEQEAAEAHRQSKQRPLTTDEREEIANGLKAKWQNLNAQYQKITHMTVLDTISKVRRKESYERELDQVEKDIKLLGRNEPIIVDLEH